MQPVRRPVAAGHPTVAEHFETTTPMCPYRSSSSTSVDGRTNRTIPRTDRARRFRPADGEADFLDRGRAIYLVPGVVADEACPASRVNQMGT